MKTSKIRSSNKIKKKNQKPNECQVNKTMNQTYNIVILILNTYMAKFMVEQKILRRLGNLVTFPGDKLYTGKTIQKINEFGFHIRTICHLLTLVLNDCTTEAALPVQLIKINPKQRDEWANP